MAAKQLLFSEAGTRQDPRGRGAARQGRQGHARPARPQCRARQEVGLAHGHQGRRDGGEEIELDDPYHNMGAQMVREVASKTSDVAGDGTTTATVLAESIFREGLKNVTAGSSPMYIKRGIEKAVEAVVEELKKLSRTVKENKEIEQVATISANSDTIIGKMIAEAMDKVGKDGTITVEEARSVDTTLEVGRGHAVRQGLHLALLRDRRRRTWRPCSKTPSSCSTTRSCRT